MKHLRKYNEQKEVISYGENLLAEVRMDDWVGLYWKDKLVFQDHSLESDELIPLCIRKKIDFGNIDYVVIGLWEFTEIQSNLFDKEFTDNLPDSFEELMKFLELNGIEYDEHHQKS